MSKKIIIKATLSVTGVLLSLGILKTIESASPSGFKFACEVHALSQNEASVFSQNDITFYDPSECQASSGSSPGAGADTSFKIDNNINAADFWYVEGCLAKCIRGSYAHTKFDTQNPFLRSATQNDDSLGGMQYIYAENYDIDFSVWPAKFTRKPDTDSTRKYYWIVLPSEAYTASPGETYVATFENLNEPIYFITFDAHACEHQSEHYCEKARANPDGVEAGKQFLGAITKDAGNPRPVYDKTGRLTSLHRINGKGEVLAKEFPTSGSVKFNSNTTPDSTPTNTSSPDISAEWQDGWLVEGSIPGSIKEDVNGKSDLSEKPHSDGSFTTDSGKPNKILLHYTAGTTSGYAAYPSGNKFPAHFTIDAKNKKIVQAFSLNQPSLAIKTHDKSAGIQIEIVSMGYDDYSKYSDEEWDYLATLLVAISKETGIPLTSSVQWSGTPAKLSIAAFNQYEGVLGHMHAPGNDHTDPGDIWKFLEPAIERVGGDSVSSSSANSCNSYTGDYPQYYQGNFEKSDHGPDTHDWTMDPYGGKTIADTGCGATSMAMLATVATGQDIYPHDIAKVLDEDYPNPSSTLRFYNKGNPLELDPIVGKRYGFEVVGVPTNGKTKSQVYDEMKKYLNDGYMLHFSGAGCHEGFASRNSNGSCTSGHYVGIFSIDANDRVQVANSNRLGNTETDLQNLVDAFHNDRFTAIKKGSGSNKNTCINLCEGGDSQNNVSSNGDVVAAVAKIIELANQNGSTYPSDGHGGSTGGNRSIASYKAMLNDGANVFVDCTGFASFAHYVAYPDTFQEGAIFSSASLPYNDTYYEKIDKKDARPGDIFRYTGHGGIIIEVENGIITKIAETGGEIGRSGKNNNIGYSDASDYSVQKANSSSGEVYRWKGKN